VAVGDYVSGYDAGPAPILTSPDGVTWTARTSGTDRLYGVTWGGNQFVAVGDYQYGDDTILTSPNGVTWTARTSGTPNGLRGVTWGVNRFVAVGDSGTIVTNTCGGAVTAPVTLTIAATAVTASGATLNGTVNDQGATTTVSFDYGKTTSYGTTVAATPATINAGVGTRAVAATRSGLACNTLYHYRVKAVNGVGTTYGGDLSFTTSACP